MNADHSIHADPVAYGVAPRAETPCTAPAHASAARNLSAKGVTAPWS